jgi:hypothetical protein
LLCNRLGVLALLAFGSGHGLSKRLRARRIRRFTCRGWTPRGASALVTSRLLQAASRSRGWHWAFLTSSRIQTLLIPIICSSHFDTRRLACSKRIRDAFPRLLSLGKWRAAPMCQNVPVGCDQKTPLSHVNVRLGSKTEVPGPLAMSAMTPIADVNQRDRQGRARRANATA